MAEYGGYGGLFDCLTRETFFTLKLFQGIFALSKNTVNIRVCVCARARARMRMRVHAQLYLSLWDPIAHQVPLSMEFSSQEYWSGLPFPAPGSSS